MEQSNEIENLKKYIQALKIKYGYDEEKIGEALNNNSKVIIILYNQTNTIQDKILFANTFFRSFKKGKSEELCKLFSDDLKKVNADTLKQLHKHDVLGLIRVIAIAKDLDFADESALKSFSACLFEYFKYLNIEDPELLDSIITYNTVNYLTGILDPEIAIKYQDKIIKKLENDNAIESKYTRSDFHHVGNKLLLYLQEMSKRGALDNSKINWDEIWKNMINEDVSLYVVKQLMKEVIEHEKKAGRISGNEDIKIIGMGAYSVAIQIGKYVYKVGKERGFNECDWHRRTLQSVLRIQTNLKNKEEKVENKKVPRLFVEIQPFENANWYENMTEEQIEEILYMVWKDYKSSGINWYDIKKENVVQLLEDNVMNYETEVMDLVKDDKTGELRVGNMKKEVLPFNEMSIQTKGIRRDEAPLKKGDYVVADTDFITEKDFPPVTRRLFTKFSQRYEEENDIKRKNTDRENLNDR